LNINSDQYCQFYFIRHGKTEWNKEFRLQGDMDIPISEEGELDSYNLLKTLKDVSFDVIITNQLCRTQNTAKIFANNLKIPVITDKLIKQRDWGNWNGRLLSDLLKFYRKSPLGALGKPYGKIVGYNAKKVEKYSVGAVRAKKFILQSASKYRGKIVLVVTHGFILNSLLATLKMKKLPNPYCSHRCYLKIRSDGNKIILDEVYGVKNKVLNI